MPDQPRHLQHGAENLQVHLPNDPELELQQLRSTVFVLSVALACATQPGGQALLRQAWRLLRPPISDAELDRIAATWELEPKAAG